MDTTTSPARPGDLQPVARYIAEPHTELAGCFQVTRYSRHATQSIGSYTDWGAAQDAASHLNTLVRWETT